MVCWRCLRVLVAGGGLQDVKDVQVGLPSGETLCGHNRELPGVLMYSTQTFEVSAFCRSLLQGSPFWPSKCNVSALEPTVPCHLFHGWQIPSGHKLCEGQEFSVAGVCLSGI